MNSPNCRTRLIANLPYRQAERHNSSTAVFRWMRWRMCCQRRLHIRQRDESCLHLQRTSGEQYTSVYGFTPGPGGRRENVVDQFKSYYSLNGTLKDCHYGGPSNGFSDLSHKLDGVSQAIVP